MAVTIKDVAQRSGYAVGTVSRVLNSSASVSDTAREKILATVEELGFTPNNNARQLKQREGRGYGIIVKGAGNRLFAGIVEEMQRRFSAAGKTVTLHYLDEDNDEVEQAVQLCRERKPLGILFLGGNRENFVRKFTSVPCPCVLVTTRADSLGFSNLSSVCTDDVAGAAEAMGHLLDAGHREVGVIGGDSSVLTPAMGSNTSALRLLGCQQAHLQRGLSFDPNRQAVAARFSLQGGYDAACRLLDRNPGITAIFAMADIMAIGALRAIQDRGLRVPEDISIVGYDGIEQSAYCIPRLTTVRQNAGRLAQRSVDILLQHTEGTEAVHEIIPFQLVCGESVRKVL